MEEDDQPEEQLELKVMRGQRSLCDERREGCERFNRNRAVKHGSYFSCKPKPSTEEVEVTLVSPKRSPGRRKEERVDSFQEDAKGQTGRSQSTALKSTGIQKKDKKGFLYDLKEQQA
ncbi:hypothetical protein QJS04_geneDACA010116 [Acorus gramineus]|uniref:Uncharacterized protein n=1 Tax=Acorus gramineus TaxID=55184 RepID=A0AAV9BFG7_ACOGR|nr:hypothetical protein QJS04_geneDACA010116 [Acorus gramineus]